MSAFPIEGPVEVIAHRGFSERAPENTLTALSAGLGAGADAVEFDLQPASDGTPHLFHDATLDRTTDGTGPIRALPPERIAELDAGSWLAPGFAGEPVPTLDTALDLLGPGGGRIYAEIKGYRELDDVDRIAAAVAARELLDRTCFISMDWAALARLRETAATALLGYIVEDASRLDGALDRAAGDARALIDFDARILLTDPAVARRVTRAGVPMAVWTVDDVSDAERLRAMGVRRFTTNRVEALVEWKRTL